MAKAAGYSKATLYVYFKNKEEIVGVLVLEIMPTIFTFWEMLSGFIQTASNKENYIAKEMGRFVCANTSKREQLPKFLTRKIGRCWK